MRTLAPFFCTTQAARPRAPVRPGYALGVGLVATCRSGAPADGPTSAGLPGPRREGSSGGRAVLPPHATVRDFTRAAPEVK